MEKETKTNENNEELLHPLSYQTLTEDNEIKSALSKVRENVGKSEYNTRLDILQKIKEDSSDEDVSLDKFDKDDLSEGYDVEKTSSKMTVMETLNELSDVNDTNKEEEEKEEEIEVISVPEEKVTPLTKKQKKALIKQEKKLKKQEEKIRKEELKQAKKAKKKGVFNTILNIIILILTLVVIGLIVYTVLGYLNIV